jgi:hypothetical protein
VLWCALLYAAAGVDFAIKRMVVGDNNIKLTIWDTAGGEDAKAPTDPARDNAEPGWCCSTVSNG